MSTVAPPPATLLDDRAVVNFVIHGYLLLQFDLPPGGKRTDRRNPRRHATQPG